MKANDAPGCLLPSGNVLCAAGPAPASGFATPTFFFEYNPAANSLTSVPSPPTSNTVVYAGRMLLLPTGQVLFAQGSTDIEVYTPTGGPKARWRPKITAHPHKVHAGQTYTLHGRRLNGLSQAVSYGDDAQMATNYPLVRLINKTSGRIVYCPTFDHSTMAVATGNLVVSTNFMVPWSAEPGPSDLCVVANGISSVCVRIRVKSFEPRHYEAWELLIGSLADGPLWVLTPDGPRPVDPYNGRLAERARSAFEEIRKGIRELQSLGGEIGTLRAGAKTKTLTVRPSREGKRGK